MSAGLQAAGAGAFGAGFVWSAQQARDQAVDRVSSRALIGVSAASAAYRALHDVEA